jgi:hypothetical protein
MITSRAASPRRKRVPCCTTAVGEIFWIIAVATEPTARRHGSPFAARAAYAVEVFFYLARSGLFAVPLRFERFLKEPQRYCETVDAVEKPPLQIINTVRFHFFSS